MELKEMSIEQLEERKTAIVAELDNPEADLDALQEEARSIKEEIETRKETEAKKAEIRQNVAMGEGTVVHEFAQVEERTEMNEREIRSSAEYCEAYKNYIIKGDDTECRTLLTTDASGKVPVPTILEDGIKTAWENDAIMSRVKKTFIRGNLKVAFEKSADGAYVHAEGTSAPTEEALDFGIVELKPENIKKWIKISDEAAAMGGEAFVRYIYDEITYQIVKLAAAKGVANIAGASTTHSSSAIGIPKVTLAPGITTIPKAAANLSDQAENLVVIMNRLTEAEFLDAQAAGNFALDPFAGLPVIYTSALPAYSTASSAAVYAVVGDLSGLQYNFPEGEDVIIKWDDLSLAELDLVKVVGRQYAAHGVTAPGKFVNIAKPNAATT